MKIPGSVALVTGGACGLGKAYGEALLRRGAKVCFADVNVTAGLQTEQTFKEKYGEESAIFVKCDVSSDADFKGLWKTALEKFKYVDIVVNNAGILNETMPEKTIEINLMGVMRGTILGMEHMRKDKGGRGGLVINVASTAGLLPVYFLPVYAASKHGVVGLTRSWAANPLSKTYGVSFACLCPAFTDTNMLADVTAEGATPPLHTYRENKEIMDKLLYDVGVNTVDDVAAAFIELVEKDDNNGAVVTVDKTRGAVYRFTKHPHRL